jgi:hypothetical protein
MGFNSGLKGLKTSLFNVVILIYSAAEIVSSNPTGSMDIFLL